jgi:hypothetical protein
VHSVYTNLDPRYCNYKIDLNALSGFVERVREQPVRDVIVTLTSLESKQRLNVYEIMKDIKLDVQKVNILREKINLKVKPVEVNTTQANLAPNFTKTNQFNP